MCKLLLDSDKYLLSYSALINPLEPDVHHMTSQIVSILTDFYPDLCTVLNIRLITRIIKIILKRYTRILRDVKPITTRYRKCNQFENR